MEGRRQQARARTNIRWGAFCLAMLSAGQAQAAPPPSECAALPRPLMHARLTLSREAPALDLHTVRRVVDEAWQAEGVAIEWRHGIGRWDDVDFWIQVRRHRIAGAEGSIGSVAFLGDRPDRLIQVSTDAAIDRVERNLSRRLQISPASVFHLMFSNGQRIVEQTLGYAIAHEVGHYLLAEKNHAGWGLMRATFDPVGVSARPARLSLDARNREVLQARLARAGTCR